MIMIMINDNANGNGNGNANGRYIRIRQEALRKLSRRIWYTKLMQILVAACYHFA